MYIIIIRINLWGYSVETVLAEKAETILSRGLTNTRPRDYYDVFILVKKLDYDSDIFLEALEATAKHRGSWLRIKDYEPITTQIENSEVLREIWDKYRKAFRYANGISFDDTVGALRKLLLMDR